MTNAKTAASKLASLELDDLKRENRNLKKQLKLAQKDSEKMANHVEAARRANQKKTISKPIGRKKLKDDWIRLIIPDIHGSGVDMRTVGVMFRDTKNMTIDEIVLLGDFLDCGGLLSQHYTLGYVAETEYTYEDDVATGNRLLDEIMRIYPSIKKIHYLEGNHEHRVEKYCVTTAMRKGVDAKFLLDRIGPESVLDLKRRGINYYRENEFYDNLPTPGAIKLGKCFFTHGISTAKHAASVHVAQFGGNIVYGHTHRGDTYETKTLTAGQIGAWCPGCLCKLHPGYARTRVTNWTHGYGLQIVSRSGLFQTLMIRIIDGESMLIPVIKHILK